MDKIFSEITIKDLPEDTYIVKIPDKILGEGYTYFRGIVDYITAKFPQKNFVFIPKDITFENMTKEELEAMISHLNDFLKNLDGEE